MSTGRASASWTRAAPLLAILPAACTVALYLFLLPPADILARSFDPDISYLFSGLLFDRGVAPSNIDHPGLPLHYLAYAAMKGRNVLAGSNVDLATDFFQDPRPYAEAVRWACFSLFLLCQAYCAARLRRAGALFAFTVPLLPLCIHGAFSSLGRFTPELMLACFGLLLVPALQERAPVRTGMALALLLATKVNALPLLLFVWLLPSARARLTAFAAGAFFFAGLLAPEWGELPRMVSYYWKMAAHTGHYGAGEAGFSSFALLRDSAGALAGDREAAGARALGLLLFVWLAIPARTAPRERWVPALAAGLLALLVLKHPAARYLVPLAPISSLALLRTRASPPAHRMIAVALLLLPLLRVAPQWRSLHGWRAAQAGEQAKIAAVLEDPALRGCARLAVGDSPTLPRVHLFGLASSTPPPEKGTVRGELAALLRHRFPDWFFLGFNGLADFTLGAGSPEASARLARYSCAVLVSEDERAEAMIRELLGTLPPLRAQLPNPHPQGEPLRFHELRRASIQVRPVPPPPTH